MTPAGTSNELDVQNGWEENTHTQYNGGFLPDIILLTQSYLRGTRLNTMHGLCTYNLYNSILLLHCLMVYYIVSGLFLLFFWCPCMASNVSVQYNGGFLSDIILLTQCYYHRGTRSNAMKRFCIFSYRSHLNVLTFFPPDWGLLRRSNRCVLIFL